MKSRQSFDTLARAYFPGMGEAVADRTVNRKRMDGSVESWSDVAHRVALGNHLLHPETDDFHNLHHHLRQASVLMSGRHLQHGDDTQPTRNQEVFTNCATSAASFILFYLLLNGSGVGRSYDDNMIVVDLNKMPFVVPVISMSHPDVLTGEIKALTREQAEHFYNHRPTIYFEVPDSREGWAEAIERIELMAFQERSNEVLVLDFSKVRERGKPINGMQKRPASGPGPLMEAINKIAGLRNSNMPAWRAAMYADHYLAECVLVGGARRAARMATKTWRDADVLDFISVKRGGFLWSSNNSVMVDQEFWSYVFGDYAETFGAIDNDLAKHAIAVFEAICRAQYFDGTGEPGIINADKLASKMDGHEVLLDGDFAGSQRFKLSEDAKPLMKTLADRWANSLQKMITNPCGEIVLSMLGGYCVIADVVPFHAGSYFGDGSKWRYTTGWDNDAEDAFRVTTRALMRVNLMDSLYGKEVRRTNRIGVGMTGLHEYAWARFGFGWKDLIDENKSKDFWMMLSRFKRAVNDEAVKYAAKLGVAVPHTNTTMKPAGTTSKLFGLTEGAHLPSMREYLRWVQFRNDDPLIKEYERKGYPVRKLQTYNGTTIVGFPTQLTICQLGMGDKLVTAGEATPEEQYQFLRLLEKYWIQGVDEAGNPLSEDTGNQVSYTLKYKPELVSFEEFKRTLMNGQSGVRCCSVMPQVDTSAYEYQPEEPITRQQFDALMSVIRDDHHEEDVGVEHMLCDGGACPIDFRESKVSQQ